MPSITAQLLALVDAGNAVAYCRLIETRGSTPQKAGATMLVMPDGTQFGTLGGGWLTDRLSVRDARWVLWLPGLGGVLSIPFAAGAYTVDSAAAAIALLAPAALLHNVYAAVGHAAAQSLARPRMRALVAGPVSAAP